MEYTSLKPWAWFVILSLGGIGSVAFLAYTVKAILWLFKS